MRKRARNRSTHAHGNPDRAYAGTAPFSQAEALRAVGEVVYAVRVGDLVKIGHTLRLDRRRNELHADEVLAFRLGTLAEEQAIHARLVGHLHHGQEWYLPTPAVMDVVNEMRTALGLEPLAA